MYILRHRELGGEAYGATVTDVITAAFNLRVENTETKHWYLGKEPSLKVIGKHTLYKDEMFQMYTNEYTREEALADFARIIFNDVECGRYPGLEIYKKVGV